MQNPRKILGGLGNRMFQMAYIYAQVKEGNLPDIYLQNFNYFDKYRDEIKRWYGDDIVKHNYVSLHIRRGDYVNNPFYVDLTQTDYYDRAIAEFPDEKFLVFCADRQDGSDDIKDREWCMDWLRAKFGERFTLYQGFNEVMDINAMAGCTGHIMANSSFSFWAAYLSGNRTVAPLRWFADGHTIPLLEEWKKI